MPYIKQEDREYLKLYSEATPQGPGALSFQITSLVTGYVKAKGLSYQTINDIVGALEGAKLEFVRRIVNSYEDKKLAENGDVY
jgi:hypothetical protein